MSDMIVTGGVPEVTLGQTAPQAGAVPEFSGKWADMGKDLEAIQKEFGQPEQPASSPAPATVPAPVETPAIQANPAAPVVPAPAPVVPAVEVPEKFRDASGKLDQEKLLKSYFEAEKGLKRAQNAQPQTPPQAQPQQPAPAAPQGPMMLTPFERQVAQDLVNEAAAAGYAMPEGQAIAQAKVQIRLTEAKHQADRAATFAKVDHFEQTLAEQNSRRELESLAKDNPWVLTPDGYQQITAIQAEKPWMFKDSPTPFADAVEVLLGRRSKSGPQGLVSMPNPTGAQQAVSPLPVTPTPVAPNPIALNTQAEIEAHLKTLTPDQETQFWKKMGMKWDTPKQFRGI